MKGIRQIGIPLRGVETAMGLRAGKLKIFLGGIDSQEADRSAPLDVSAHRRKIRPVLRDEIQILAGESAEGCLCPKMFHHRLPGETRISIALGAMNHHPEGRSRGAKDRPVDPGFLREIERQPATGELGPGKIRFLPAADVCGSR